LSAPGGLRRSAGLGLSFVAGSDTFTTTVRPGREGPGSGGTPAPGPTSDGASQTPAPALEGRRVSVEQKVIEIVCEHLAVNKEQVTRNTNFIEDIGADSLDIVELIMELEEEFDIQIPDEQAEKIKTVGEAIDYIERETKKKS
jgi:acyl carrier protein